MFWGSNPERRVVMPAGAFKFLKNYIRQNGLGQKPRATGCHARRGLQISQKLLPTKMIWGKNPERRVVMPAGAFKFLKNDILQK